MKILKTNIFYLISIIINLFIFIPYLNAQSLIDSTQYKKFYYANGVLSSEGFLVDGKPDGYWKTYYETGILKSEGNRKNFYLDGLWKFYDDIGNLFLEINYMEDKKQGIRKTITDNEIIEEHFENDIRQGFTKHFYKEGTIKKEVYFDKDKETGIAKEYSKEGLIIVLTEYRNGNIIRRENINRFDRNKNKQGVWKYFYENDILKEEGFYVNGKKNGYFKEYDNKGALLKISKYINDEIQHDVPELSSYEIRTDYYTNGTIKVVGSYKNGIPEGIRREYASDGKISNAYIFEKGKISGEGIVDEKGNKQGFWKEFYDTGVLKAEGYYKNNIKTGDWKFYSENQKIKQTGKFNNNGLQIGEWKWFYENGNIQKTENFKSGILEGLNEEFDENGNIICKGHYEEGNEDGFWFFVTNNYRQEGTFSYGRRNGIWKQFYDNGQLKFEGNYIDDYPDGKHIYYWENGKRKEERIYIMGKPEGTWRKYDEYGALIIYVDYKRGYEYRYDGVIIKPIIED